MSWKRHARLLGYLLLGGVTAYGVYRFLAGGEAGALAALSAWRGKGPSLALAGLLALASPALDGVCWSWVYRLFGVRVGGMAGAGAYLCSFAGLMLPVQLGRALRPDAVRRLGLGSFRHCAKAELANLSLDALALVATSASLAGFLIHPLLAPAVAAGSVAAMLAAAHVLAGRLTGSRWRLPERLWLGWQTPLIVAVKMVTWLVFGLALYVLISDLAPDVGAAETTLLALVSSGMGSGSGLPGGVGVIEALLGVSLKVLRVPPAQWAIAIGAFRVMTFWVLLPVGWLAMTLVGRRAAGQGATQPPDSEKPLNIER